MPVYKEELAPKRSKTGYDSLSYKARRARLEHQALAYVLHGWDERTAESKKAGEVQQRGQPDRQTSFNTEKA